MFRSIGSSDGGSWALRQRSTVPQSFQSADASSRHSNATRASVRGDVAWARGPRASSLLERLSIKRMASRAEAYANLQHRDAWLMAVVLVLVVVLGWSLRKNPEPTVFGAAETGQSQVLVESQHQLARLQALEQRSTELDRDIRRVEAAMVGAEPNPRN